MNGIGCRVKKPLKIARFVPENAIIAANLHPLQVSNIRDFMPVRNIFQA
jgi:hypothetical protein